MFIVENTSLVKNRCLQMKLSLVASFVRSLHCLYFKKHQRHFETDVKVGDAFVCRLILGTGNTVIEAVKVLLEHGVQPSVIILLSLFSTPHGKFSARR